MSLTCSCGEDWEPGMVIWYAPKDYTSLQTKRRQRCCSCKELIDLGAICAEVPRFRVPDGDIQERIYGEDGEIPIASKWLCERCADFALILDELGYCPQPFEDQRELVKEYAELKQWEREERQRAKKAEAAQ